MMRGVQTKKNTLLNASYEYVLPNPLVPKHLGYIAQIHISVAVFI
jgi:hypothetical protein